VTVPPRAYPQRLNGQFADTEPALLVDAGPVRARCGGLDLRVAHGPDREALHEQPVADLLDLKLEGHLANLERQHPQARLFQSNVCRSSRL
jgi:hypothetical protein